MIQMNNIITSYGLDFDFWNAVRYGILPGIIGGVIAELLVRWWYKRRGISFDNDGLYLQDAIRKWRHR